MKHHCSNTFAANLLGTILCIVFTGPARSQTITAGELLAPIGWTSQHYPIADYIPWDTLMGTGVIWDYAWVDVDTAVDIGFAVIDVTDAPGAVDYPDADRVVRRISGAADDYVTDQFYDQLTDRILELGSVGPVLSYSYDAPGIAYGLPMALGDTIGDDYCYWSDGLGVQYHFCGETRVAFDAMGTLVLPNGTYSDVKHVTLWSSSFETTGASTDSSYSVKQQWFLPGIAFPVLESSIFIAEDGALYPGGRLMSEASVTGMKEQDGMADWSIHPNPTSGSITIQRDASRPAVVDVLSLDGRVVLTSAFSPGSVRLDISLGDLPDGAYLVRLVDDVASSAQRVLKVGGR